MPVLRIWDVVSLNTRTSYDSIFDAQVTRLPGRQMERCWLVDVLMVKCCC